MLDLLTAYTVYQSQNQNQENFNYIAPLPPFYWIISIIIGLFAAYLAFQCNRKENIAFQLAATVLAFIFSGWYLIYYVIRYSLLGGKC